MINLRSLSFDGKQVGPQVQSALSLFLNLHASLNHLSLDDFIPSREVRVSITSMSQLRTLKVALSLHTADALKEDLRHLVAGCPLVHSFDLHLKNGFFSSQIIPFDSIRPLLDLEALTCLRITSLFPMDLESEDISEMGRAWRNMVELELTPRPSDRCSIFLEDLQEFAVAFSSTLKTLAVPATGPLQVPSPDKVAGSFPSLNKLDVDAPDVDADQVQEVAAFLAVICPPGVVIKWREKAGDRETAVWGEIAALMRTMHLVHVQRALRERE